MLLALSSGQKLGIAGVAAVFIGFALASSFLFPRVRPDFPGRGLRFFVVLSLLLLAGMLTAMVTLAKESEEEGGHEAEATATATGEESETGETETGAATETAPAEAAGDAAAGKKVFLSAGCVSCHTLADAGATGTVGPNLDEAKPDAELVAERVTNGKGVMPSFKGQLSETQIRDVAAYVSSVAGK